MLPTMTCLTAVLADHLLHRGGEILQHDDRLGAGILELVFEFARGVERIDVHHRVAGAQHGGGRNRILQHVRHHQRDAGALRQALALQIGGERQRHLVEIAIADRLVHADEGLAVARISQSFLPADATSDAYWVTSISAGTPAGYCLSQIRSMIFPLRIPVRSPLPGRDALFRAVLSNAAADGKRQPLARRCCLMGAGLPAAQTAGLSCVGAAAGLLIRGRLGVAGRCSWAWPRSWALPALRAGLSAVATRLFGRLSGRHPAWRWRA